MERRKLPSVGREWWRSRWWMPAFALFLGALVLAAMWIGGDRDGGLKSFAVLAVVAALFAFGGRSDTLRGLDGPGRDERWAMIDLRASAFAGLVVLAVLIGTWLWELAHGDDGSPYSQFLAIAGVSYIVAVARRAGSSLTPSTWPPSPPPPWRATTSAGTASVTYLAQLRRARILVARTVVHATLGGLFSAVAAACTSAAGLVLSGVIVPWTLGENMLHIAGVGRTCRSASSTPRSASSTTSPPRQPVALLAIYVALLALAVRRWRCHEIPPENAAQAWRSSSPQTARTPRRWAATRSRSGGRRADRSERHAHCPCHRRARTSTRQRTTLSALAAASALLPAIMACWLL
jgi:hypothetical protein